MFLDRSSKISISALTSALARWSYTEAYFCSFIAIKRDLKVATNYNIRSFGSHD